MFLSSFSRMCAEMCTYLLYQSVASTLWYLFSYIWSPPPETSTMWHGSKGLLYCKNVLHPRWLKFAARTYTCHLRAEEHKKGRNHYITQLLLHLLAPGAVMLTDIQLQAANPVNPCQNSKVKVLDDIQSERNLNICPLSIKVSGCTQTGKSQTAWDSPACLKCHIWKRTFWKIQQHYISWVRSKGWGRGWDFHCANRLVWCFTEQSWPTSQWNTQKYSNRRLLLNRFCGSSRNWAGLQQEKKVTVITKTKLCTVCVFVAH